MTELTVVLPALNTPWHVVDDKLVRLAAGFEATLNLVVQAHSPALKRSYFFSDSLSVDAQAQFKDAVTLWCDTLAQRLSEAGVNHRIEIVWEREILKYLKSNAPNKDSLLVLISSASNLTQDYRSVIRRIETPILLLYSHHWESTISTVAAVDPVHEDDLPMARDTAVVESATQLAAALSGSVQLVHSCFVPPYLSDHREDILTHHRANIRDFIADGNFAELEYDLINGDPTVALREYVKANDISVLALGSVVRGLFDRPSIGSTTESFLSKLPCDLLLVHS